MEQKLKFYTQRNKKQAITKKPALDFTFCYRLSRTQGHSATGRIMSLKNSNNTIGNRTRDLPVGSEVHNIEAARCIEVNKYLWNPGGLKLPCRQNS
jgi:hypothetical protein